MTAPLERDALAALLSSARDAILERWLAGARGIGRGAELSPDELRDNVPELICALSDVVRQLAAGESPTALADLPERHAATRLHQRYSTADVVDEYALLRECTFAQCPAAMDRVDVLRLAKALDVAQRRTIESFDSSGERLLRALDAVSTLTLEGRGESELLETLLGALMNASGAIDSAAILLAVEGRLVVRAAVGIAAEREPHFSVAVGEGFAGTIAGTRTPLCLRDASHDPLVVSPTLRARGVRALCGVPLVDGDRLVGVAHIGSRTVNEFSHEEQILFRTIAGRVTAVILNARLVAQLQQAVRERDDFLSVASHELNTPLTTLQLSLDSLERRLRKSGEPLPQDKLLGRLDSLRHAVERIARLVANVLDLSRVRHHQLRLATEPVELGELLDDVVRRLRPLAGSRKVELRVVGAGAREPIVGRWDRARLEQVFSNLLTNAIKYGEQKPVEVAIERDGDEAILRVRDRGIGITPDAMPRIFGRYERHTEEAGERSLGLGLYVASEIVKAHGGRIEAESAGLGAGACFTVRLPLAGPEVDRGNP